MTPEAKLVLCLLLLSLCHYHEASTPVFLQAISSALGSIPFSGFPFSMTTGLTGAKLAVGAKLLYYLGLFGRGGSPKSSMPMPTMTQQGFNPGMNQMPFMPGKFPSAAGGFPAGFPTGMPGLGQSLFAGGRSQFQAPSKPAPDPAALITALAAQGINPLQLMQALESAGIDPGVILQSLGGGRSPMGGGVAGPGNRAGVPNSPAFPPQMMPNQGAISQNFANVMPQDFSNSMPPSPENDSPVPPSEGAPEEDIESFFQFLKDMDDNKCISRLICDIGGDPNFLGEFTQNIDSIINSLEVPPESGAHEYIEIMESGRNEGRCAEKFPECSDDAYEIVKSVAPSVGVPGINAGDSNIL